VDVPSFKRSCASITLPVVCLFHGKVLILQTKIALVPSRSVTFDPLKAC